MNKIRLMRVITDARVIPWHLGKTLQSMSDDFQVFVVGEKASTYSPYYKNVTFIDAPIGPKINVLLDIFALLKLFYIILKVKPHIIHSVMPKAAFLSSIAALVFVPIRIHTFTGQVWQTMTGFRRSCLKVIDKVIVFANTLCFTDSASQSNFLFDEGIGYRNAPLPVISKGSLGGVDLNKIRIGDRDKWCKDIRNKYGIGMDSFVIGFLARKTKDKGALLMLDVFSRISRVYPDVFLLFVGPDDSGGELGLFKQNCPSWDKNVIEVGAVSSHEKYLSAFDLLCLPSFREGFGSIVIDAAALGIPTIGSRIPGLVDAIDELSTGILFNCGDADDLYEKILLCLDDISLVSFYGARAYERVINHYDSESFTKQLEVSYRSLVELKGLSLY